MKKIILILIFILNQINANEKINIEHLFTELYSIEKEKEYKDFIIQKSNFKCNIENDNMLCDLTKPEIIEILESKEIKDINIIKQLDKSKKGSIGVFLRKTIENETIIVDIYEESDAKNKIQKNDKLLKIDEKETSDLALMEITNMLNGDIDSVIKLTIERKNKVIELDIKRKDKNNFNTDIKSKNKNKNLTINIFNFDKNTTAKIEELLLNENYEKVTLDLRNSYGGQYNEILYTLGLFLDKNTMLYKRTRTYDNEEQYPIQKTNKLFNKKLKIIIDESTQSGTLLFAYSLIKNYKNIEVENNGNGIMEGLYTVKPVFIKDYKVDSLLQQTNKDYPVYLASIKAYEIVDKNNNVLSGKILNLK